MAEELVTEQTADSMKTSKISSETSFWSGEILAIKEGPVLHFNEFAKTSGSEKNVSKKMIEEIPVGPVSMIF